MWVSRIRNYQSDGDAATVAGDAGPGFHTWPPAHILQNPDSNPLIRIPKKSFGETFGAATGVSAPSYKRTTKPHPNPPTGGDAATVATDAGPGFHTWPPAHILQNPDSNPLIRIPKKSFGETFGAATGVSAPSYRKTKNPHPNPPTDGDAATDAGPGH
jgi:hypothetical protein